jgi:hypothetical protein
MKEPKAFFEDKIETQLRAFDEDLNEWEIKVENMGWEPELDNEREIVEFRLMLQAMEKEYQELKATEGLPWKERKETLESDFEKFGRSLRSAVARWEEIMP